MNLLVIEFTEIQARKAQIKNSPYGRQCWKNICWVLIRNCLQDLLCLLLVVVCGGTDGRGSRAFGLPEQSNFPFIIFCWISIFSDIFWLVIETVVLNNYQILPPAPSRSSWWQFFHIHRQSRTLLPSGGRWIKCGKNQDDDLLDIFQSAWYQHCCAVNYPISLS